MIGPIPTPRLLGAFLRRDIGKEFSYPVAFLLSFASMLLQASLWFFTARFVGPGLPEGSVPGNDYFGFVIVGWAFLGYLNVSLFSFANNLREEQLAGTLEMLFATPEREDRMIICFAGWNYLWQTVTSLIYLAIARAFGVEWTIGDGFAGALVVLLLTVIVYVSIGLIGAAYTITFKKGMAIAVAASSLTTIFGGVLYPVETLGPTLSQISRLVPATYVNRGLRTALLEGGRIEDLGSDITALTLFAVVLVPLGLTLFRRSVEAARHRGDLTTY